MRPRMAGGGGHESEWSLSIYCFLSSLISFSASPLLHSKDRSSSFFLEVGGTREKGELILRSGIFRSGDIRRHVFGRSLADGS